MAGVVSARGVVELRGCVVRATPWPSVPQLGSWRYAAGEVSPSYHVDVKNRAKCPKVILSVRVVSRRCDVGSVSKPMYMQLVTKMEYPK